jgi:hypothetical protein
MADPLVTSDYERLFFETAKTQTGHNVEEWMRLIRETGLTKHIDIREWVKSTHNLDHMQATFLAFIFENGGKPAFNPDELVDALFSGKPQVRALHDVLVINMKEAHPLVRFVPKKTYVSLDGEKVLGCATPTKECLRVGLDLGVMPFEGRVLKAKSLGAMPNITHMVEVREATDIDADLMALVGIAYERTRKVKKTK